MSLTASGVEGCVPPTGDPDETWADLAKLGFEEQNGEIVAKPTDGAPA